MKITESRYFEASENYEGYCTTCDYFTKDQTEPDAKNYKCPVCNEMTVIGAENAMIMGYIEFEE
jgi:Zn finger protein HypA/HybF involved in hydrogenase expression